MQPLLSKVPVMTANGNHEIEVLPQFKAPLNVAFSDPRPGLRMPALVSRWFPLLPT